MTTFYKKQGRRYIPVSEYDHELTDAFPEGTHITVCRPGSSSRRYRIDPALAPLIAAAYLSEEAITKVIMDQLSYQPKTKPITPEQKEAWENMQKVFGEDLCRLQSGSIMDAVRAGTNEMVRQAELLLDNPALKQSHDNFILLSKLIKGE